jgi:transposase
MRYILKIIRPSLYGLQQHDKTIAVWQAESMVSREKRELVSHARKREMGVREMPEVYEVPRRTIRGLLQRERETGNMEPATENRGRLPAVDASGLEHMKAPIEGQPDISLAEIKKEMRPEISVSAISRKIKHTLGFNFTKNSAGRKREQ